MTSISEYDHLSSIVRKVSARKLLRDLGDETVDLIVTSPPYFVGKEYDWSRSVGDFLDEFRHTLPAMLSALKPGGNLCLQVGNHVQDGRLTPLDAIIITELMLEPSLVLRNRIVWTFGHGVHASSRFSGRHETILWYTKGDHYYFDVDEMRVAQRYPGKRHYKGPNKGDWSGNPLGKNPGDAWDIGAFWDIPNVKSNHVEKTEHPCQFPVALARRLVAALSPLGGLVVDPYIGSGTTAVAALLEGRNAAGCDVERKYVDIAKRRVEQLRKGTLIVRQDVPVATPDARTAVAQLPAHFRSLRGEKDANQETGRRQS